MINLINKLLFLLNLPLITRYSPYSNNRRYSRYVCLLQELNSDIQIPYSLCKYLESDEIYKYPELMAQKPFLAEKVWYWWNINERTKN